MIVAFKVYIAPPVASNGFTACLPKVKERTIICPPTLLQGRTIVVPGNVQFR